MDCLRGWAEGKLQLMQMKLEDMTASELIDAREHDWQVWRSDSGFWLYMDTLAYQYFRHLNSVIGYLEAWGIKRFFFNV